MYIRDIVKRLGTISKVDLLEFFATYLLKDPQSIVISECRKLSVYIFAAEDNITNLLPNFIKSSETACKYRINTLREG